MGWWAELTGKSGARRAEEAYAQSNKLLEAAYGKSYGYLDQQRADQLAALQGGYAQGRSTLGEAEGAAAGYINQGTDAARGDVGQYYDRAAGNVEDYFARTQGYLDPFVERGNQSADLYQTALGTNGAGAQSDFYDNYASNDPFRAYRDELANKELQAQFNARGQSGSGRMTQAVSRASLERGSTDLNQYLDRLQQAGAQGQQAATTMAGMASNTGQTLAGINTRQGDQLSGLEANRGNNLANNAAQFGTQRATLDVNQGRDVSGVEGSYGQQKIGLTTGQAGAQGNNIVGSAAAVNQARQGGMNNLIGLGSMAIKAFTPGFTGVSPIGSLFGNNGNTGTTTPGTKVNGGWTTTTTKANPLMNLWN